MTMTPLPTVAWARRRAALGLLLCLICLSASASRPAFHHGRAEHASQSLPARLSGSALQSQVAPERAAPDSPARPPVETGIRHVLVLGSTGLIGSAVSAVLTQAGYTVHQVRHRYDVDLRVSGTLQHRFADTPIDFAFFLACEIGGSKYLHAPGVQQRLSDNNIAMYDSVLPFLEARRIPFLFSSSVHSAFNSTYGRMKLDGEKRVLAGGVGRVAKFWNVYGYEKAGLRSHVLSDWLHACASGRSVISSLTDGHERKQFVYVDDLARALVDMMAGFAGLAPVTDVTTGAWTSMRQVAGLVTRATGGACRVRFSSTRAPVSAEPEPAHLWKVRQDMGTSLHHMLARYRADVAKDVAWRTRDEVFLSIIVASTNDDYNGIRARMFAFTHHLSAAAEEVGLDYELIVVQYNPRLDTDYLGKPYNASTDDELPLSQLLPLTAESARARLRIVSVPPDLHRHADKGKLWEFVAKNAGIRRARGRFVLLTNMDDIFPRDLLAWLAKEHAQADTVLRAHIILNFAPDRATDMQGACDAAAAAVTVLPETAGQSCSPAPSTISTAGGALARAGWASGGTPYDVRNCFMGDFSLWSRDAFIRTGGYIETYQNVHVETAHRQYVQQWAGSPIKHWQFVDQPTCHQAHERRGRPAAPFSPGALVQQHKGRAENATWGIVEQALPTATAASVLDRGYNPLTPYALYRHHPVFDGFHISRAPFEAAFLVDFVGTKTLYEYDCDDWGGYRRFHLGRRVLCERHDAFKAMGVGATGLPLLGDLPVMDEEYFEWVSLLQAVNAYADRNNTLPPRPFVVTELGPRYGTWAARGARAVLAKVPDAGVEVCVVGGDPTAYKRMIAHLERNVPPSTRHFMMHGVVANQSGSAVPAGGRQAEPGGKKQAPTVTTVSVVDALAQYDIVDIVHMDIQGAEAECLAADTMAVLGAKVKALHMGTHTRDDHRRLRARFVAAGWSVTHDVLPNGGVPPGQLEQTEFGPVNFYWDGELRVINAGLVGA